jgi:hypothetical protein
MHDVDSSDRNDGFPLKKHAQSFCQQAAKNKIHSLF